MAGSLEEGVRYVFNPKVRVFAGPMSSSGLTLDSVLERVDIEMLGAVNGDIRVRRELFVMLNSFSPELATSVFDEFLMMARQRIDRLSTLLGTFQQSVEVAGQDLLKVASYLLVSNALLGKVNTSAVQEYHQMLIDFGRLT